MKTKTSFKLLFFFIIVLVCCTTVFALAGSSTDETISTKSGTGTSATQASSSDSSITSTVSTGASVAPSSYSSSDSSISGSSGSPITTTTTTSTSTSTSTTTSTTTSSSASGGSSIPSAKHETTETAEKQTENEEETADADQEAVQETQTLTGAVIAEQTPLTITKEMKAGDSLALSPTLVPEALATLFVSEITEKTVTLQIITEDDTGNLLTGNVVVDIGEEVALTVGESMELDADNDNSVDIMITVTEINFDNDEYVASFEITYYFADKVTKDFVQQQINAGEVHISDKREKLSFAVWIIVGIIIFVSLLIILISQRKKFRIKNKFS